MIKEKVLRIIILIFIGLFISVLIAEQTGYYKIKTTENKIMTEEEIKRFEEDIKNGVDIDVSSYTSNNYKNYNNQLSDDIYNISLKLEVLFDGAIKKIFGMASKLVTN